jgi:hypothetical protein
MKVGTGLNWLSSAIIVGVLEHSDEPSFFHDCNDFFYSLSSVMKLHAKCYSFYVDLVCFFDPILTTFFTLRTRVWIP